MGNKPSVTDPDQVYRPINVDEPAKSPGLSGNNFKVLLHKHWRAILALTAVLLVIITVAVVLSVVLLRDKKANPSTSVFNGPDVNGDVGGAPADQFGLPQIITNPLSTDTAFGTRLFVHDAGYLCVVSKTAGGEALNFYQTDINGGSLSPQQRINLYEYLPSGYVVCDGMFAPIFNINDEVYYLFLSVGPASGGSIPPPDAAAGTTNYATNVLLIAMDTTVGVTNSLVWQVTDINADTDITSTLAASSGPSFNRTSLKIPFPGATFLWDATKPWIGTFGDLVKVILDDTEQIVKQSLYVRGSEFNPLLPGGNLYWFVLSGNGMTLSPQISLSFVIQDARLFLLQQCQADPTCAAATTTPEGKTPCPAFTKTPADYINGFASDFFVTTGQGKNNVLVAANSTGEDNCMIPNIAQPAAPQGYVQGYTFDSSSTDLGWIQPESSTNNVFNYRYPGTLTDKAVTPGFANSVAWIDNFVIVGQATPASNGNAQYLVYPWVTLPYDTSSDSLKLTSTMKPGGESAEPFKQTPLYRGGSGAPSQRYNLTVKDTNNNNNLLVTTWYNEAGDVISIQNPLKDATQPFTDFITIQNIGAGVSSQVATDPPVTKTGFAQDTNTWLSRTGLTIRLTTNDPKANAGQGRIIVWSKARSG